MMKRIKKTVRKILPDSLVLFLKAAALLWNPYYKRITSLEIKNCGVAADGVPFVELTNGRIFYGYLPTATQKMFYHYFLQKHSKACLLEDCVNVAYDISVRYLGPVSAREALGQGKYYDFPSGSTVVEVGAFIGYYAMRAAELVGEHGRVVAIEAVEENLALLRRNVMANAFNNIVIVPKAVWNSRGTLSFQRHGRQQASAIDGVVHAQEGFEVNCDTIDSILSELKIDKPDFIRIQINGAEQEALAGMTQTLKTNPKLLIAAIYRRNGRDSWVDVKAFLEARGYITEVRNGNVFAVPAANI